MSRLTETKNTRPRPRKALGRAGGARRAREGVAPRERNPRSLGQAQQKPEKERKLTFKYCR
nr:hypothetical protein [Candidatus Sigynarchaeota archaeon]